MTKEETKKDLDLDVLDQEFPEADWEWRVQSTFVWSGKTGAIVVPYITARAIMTRLDEVCGKDGWKNEFSPGPAGGILCGISILTEKGWITKFDAAENTTIEAVKGGISDSMKRAAVQWGIGRHLYSLPTAFAKIHAGGEFKARTKVQEEGREKWVNFRWDPPSVKDIRAMDKKRKKKREEVSKTATEAAAKNESA